MSELQDPPQQATCKLEFTNLHTSTMKLGATQYHQSQLVINVNSNFRWPFYSKVRPMTTSKYTPQSKMSSATKKAWNAAVSGTLAFLKPSGTIGANAGRSTEQATNTEHTLNISSIIYQGIPPVNTWVFHVADPLEQVAGLPLPPERLPSVEIVFLGHSPVPSPPSHLDVMISTYWTLVTGRSRPGGNTWLNSSLSSLHTTEPAFSNICKIISLHLPSDLQGTYAYTADLRVWPKGPGMDHLACLMDGEYQGGVEKLGEATVIEKGPLQLDIS